MGAIKNAEGVPQKARPVIPWEEKQISATSCLTKRIFDVLLSLLGLALFAPAFLIIALLIKREDKGPAIFKQERIGFRGKPFILYKFRSMTVVAEANGPMLSVKNDKRLTHVGKFLREHHLDELPQLWNVLKGDMSFVGPRPERRFFIDRDHVVESRLPPPLSVASGLVFRRNPLQRIHRHDGQNDEALAHGPALSGKPFVVG